MKLNLPQLSALAALSFAPVAHAGLFDKEDSAEPCISTFALKHAFVYDIHTCETALIVETVTQLKKDAEPACLHDTGTELKLLTEKDTKEEAKVALTATCESVKRSMEDSGGCSVYPTEGWHHGQIIQELGVSQSPSGEKWEWHQCARECAENTNCEFWTLRLQSNRACLLRKNKGDYVEAYDHIEGSSDEGCLNESADGVAHYRDIDPKVTDLFPLKLHGCTANVILEALEDECFCDPVKSLLAADSQLADAADVEAKLEAICTTAWEGIQVATWDKVSASLTNDEIAHYAEGGTELNTGTGNLDTDNQVEKYPTDPYVLNIAQDVEEYFEDAHIQDAPLDVVPGMESCANNAIMCCFGRDRQSGDANGNCQGTACDNRDPGDNSNICFKEGGTEGSVHCHGFAWGENENDVTNMMKFNNFFFVSLYDHWYTRGYVENALDSEKLFTGFPMCGCIEDMPTVSRADCSEVSVELEFEIKYSDTGFSASMEDQQRMGIKFNACTGPRYVAPHKEKSNDLSSYINKLVHQGKMSDETRMNIFNNHLVGYKNPDDNGNEAACEEYMTGVTR